MGPVALAMEAVGVRQSDRANGNICKFIWEIVSLILEYHFIVENLCIVLTGSGEVDQVSAEVALSGDGDEVITAVAVDSPEIEAAEVETDVTVAGNVAETDGVFLRTRNCLGIIKK